MTATEPRATADRPPAAGPGAPPVRHGLVLLVTCLALATVVAAMASLNVALPELARETHGSQTELSWIIDAYSLVFAALLLPAGALGDRFGRRRALLTGLALFGGGSGLAALTTDPTVLIGLRGLLGVGAALVMPATLSTITGTFPGPSGPGPSASGRPWPARARWSGCSPRARCCSSGPGARCSC